VLTFSTDPLVPYGWSDRVLALFNAVSEAAPDRAQPGPSATDLPARVTRVERAACFAVLPDGGEHVLRADPLPAVGDWISTAAGAVRQILPRWSEVTRVDPDGDRLQVLAANVDIVAVVAPADRANPARVERELALAWDCGAVPVLVVTKADLGGAEVAASLGARIPGVDVLPVCARTGAGVETLGALLRPDRTCLFLGPSGAGKSTLANALLGEDRLATGATRVDDGRGRHTTTSRQLVVIPGGGIIIDTPGLRSLSLPSDIELGLSFGDIAELSTRCRFADCRHDGEPGCAVTEAVSDGSLDPARLASFRKLAREAAFQQSRHDPLLRQANRQVWRSRTKEARANARPRRK
jgi:ribosome biogenesis GTPase